MNHIPEILGIHNRDSVKQHPALKKHVQRFMDEIGTGSGIAWVTSGREIENYVDGEKIQLAVKQTHPTLYKDAGKSRQYDHSFYF